jgi:hypothetical protein
VANAAAEAGVPHVVYSSGDGAHADNPLPSFRVNHEIEQHPRSLPIAHTILAPVYFVENLFNQWNLPALKAGTFASPIPVELPAQQVAIQDLASFATLGVEPGEFAGRRVTIASDELTAEQAPSSRTPSADTSTPPSSQARSCRRDSAPCCVARANGTPCVDLAALHHQYPEVGWHSYRAWLRSQGARWRELCPREHAESPA